MVWTRGSLGKLFAAVTPVLSGLIGDVKRVLNSYLASYPERKVDRIVLTGGGATQGSGGRSDGADGFGSGHR